MLAITNRTKDFFNSSFFKYLMIVLAANYLMLFGLETLLPGLVMEVFNLNIFLVMMLILMIFPLVLNITPKQEQLKGRGLIYFIFFVFLLSLLIALYRAIKLELIFFIILAFWGGKKLFRSI